MPIVVGLPQLVEAGRDPIRIRDALKRTSVIGLDAAKLSCRLRSSTRNFLGA